MVEDTLNQDLKQALLAKDELRITTLRSIKNALLYARVAQGSREIGLPDAAITGILQKEAKKRAESDELFARGGRPEKAERELAEKAVIEEYLPRQLNEHEIAQVIDQIISASGAAIKLGDVIREAKERTAGTADGAVIARVAKERLGA